MKKNILYCLVVIAAVLAGCDEVSIAPLGPDVNSYIVSTDSSCNFAEEYFPVEKGNKWSYKVYINPIVVKHDESDIIWDSDSVYSFEIGDRMNLKTINPDFKNNVYGYHIIHFKGKDSYYVKFKDGISLFYVTGNEIGAQVLLYDTANAADDYFGCRYTGEKEITIPLGTFDTQVFEKQCGKTRKTIYYFSKGIGYVLYENFDDKGNMLYRYTLIDYTVNP